MPKKNLLFSALILLFSPLISQTIDHPNYGLKSHPTLSIESIHSGGTSTTLFMSIENRVLDGSFCADKKIYIILPDGEKLRIKSVTGIPRCPDSYYFENIGDKLQFTLEFPALPEGTKWFDLLEDCDDACFSFNSVILNPLLNQKIDHAFSLVESKKLKEAYNEYEALLPEFSGLNCSFEGAVYYNLILLSKQLSEDDKAIEWQVRLKNSQIPLKEKFIEIIR